MQVFSIYILPSLSQRGGHNIENQMIFESNPGFIFHDSPGFEAGSAVEFNLVQEFIQKRSKAASMNGQLHAIWCVSTCIWTYFLTQKKMFWVGTVFRQAMTDQSLQRRTSFLMNAGQGLVCVILSLYYHE